MLFEIKEQFSFEDSGNADRFHPGTKLTVDLRPFWKITTANEKVCAMEVR